MKHLTLLLWTTLSVSAFCQHGYYIPPGGPPAIIARDGTYLGRLSANPYDPESTANPYGQYGSPYSPTSINNPYGTYGSPYSPQSANNPYATEAPIIIGE